MLQRWLETVFAQYGPHDKYLAPFPETITYDESLHEQLQKEFPEAYKAAEQEMAQKYADRLSVNGLKRLNVSYPQLYAQRVEKLCNRNIAPIFNTMASAIAVALAGVETSRLQDGSDLFIGVTEETTPRPGMFLCAITDDTKTLAERGVIRQNDETGTIVVDVTAFKNLFSTLQSKVRGLRTVNGPNTINPLDQNEMLRHIRACKDVLDHIKDGTQDPKAFFEDITEKYATFLCPDAGIEYTPAFKKQTENKILCLPRDSFHALVNCVRRAEALIAAYE